MDTDVPNEAALRQRVDRRQLQQIIAGLAEGIVLIDPVDGIVWANERALALHDVADLAGLGTTAAGYRKTYLLKYRNNHILTDSQYPIDRLLAGEPFENLVVEITHAESPDDGWRRICRIGGRSLSNTKGEAESHVLVIEDLTDRFTAEERFERTFNANPAPAIICRLSDLRYVKVNQGFLEMTGYAREDLIGLSVYELDVLEGAPNKETAVACLREGRTISQTEATIRVAEGGSRFVIVAGQPIELGDEGCMLFTFMDMAERKMAEDALRQSEERFASAFRMTPLPTALSTRENLRLLDVNAAFVALLGYSEEEAVGRSGPELPIWTSAVVRRQIERKIAESGSFRSIEVQLRTKAGDILDCLISGETVTIHGQDCLLTVIQDITERRRSEVELIAAIEAVMQDTSWFSRTVIEKLAELRRPRRSDKPRVGLADLTAREQEILGFMCEGLADADIVKKLGLTRNTVRNHIARIYSKADVHSRTAAVVWARERGFTGTPGKKASPPTRPRR